MFYNFNHITSIKAWLTGQPYVRIYPNNDGTADVSGVKPRFTVRVCRCPLDQVATVAHLVIRIMSPLSNTAQTPG